MDDHIALFIFPDFERKARKTVVHGPKEFQSSSVEFSRGLSVNGRLLSGV